MQPCKPEYGPQRTSCPDSWNLGLCHFTWQRELHRCVKVMDLEVGRLPWIMACQRDTTGGEVWSLERGSALAGDGDGDGARGMNPETQATLGNSSQLTARKCGAFVLQPQATKFCHQPKLARGERVPESFQKEMQPCQHLVRAVWDLWPTEL